VHVHVYVYVCVRIHVSRLDSVALTKARVRRRCVQLDTLRKELAAQQAALEKIVALTSK
jgi:hypothetical protein